MIRNILCIQPDLGAKPPTNNVRFSWCYRKVSCSDALIKSTESVYYMKRPEEEWFNCVTYPGEGGQVLAATQEIIRNYIKKNSNVTYPLIPYLEFLKKNFHSTSGNLVNDIYFKIPDPICTNRALLQSRSPVLMAEYHCLLNATVIFCEENGIKFHCRHECVTVGRNLLEHHDNDKHKILNGTLILYYRAKRAEFIEEMDAITMMNHVLIDEIIDEQIESGEMI